MWWQQYKFKANPHYKLLLLSEMNENYKKYCPTEYTQEEAFALLIPSATQAKTARLICEKTASVFVYLQQENYLPDNLSDWFDEKTESFIEALLINDIIQTVFPTETNVTLSNEALLLKNSSSSSAIDETNFIAALSYDAIQYALQLGESDKHILAAKLYFYNRLPINTKNYSKKTIENKIYQIILNQKIISNLEENWHITFEKTYHTWVNFRSKQYNRSGKIFKYKLYISPMLSDLTNVLEIMFSVFRETEVTHFKIGKNLPGLCRPDKIVAYFDSKEHLLQISHALWEKIYPYSAHGVPFSAQLYDTGILSWGMDPPLKDRTITSIEYQSWRLWVVNMIASVIISLQFAYNDGAITTEEFFTLLKKKVALEGVDYATWAPTDNILFY